MPQNHLTMEIVILTKVQTMLKLCFITMCNKGNLSWAIWMMTGVQLNDQLHLVKETLKFGTHPIKLLKSLLSYSICLRATRIFSIDATIYSLKVDMIMNIVKYDTNNSEQSTTSINEKWIIHDILKTFPLKKRGNPHSTLKGI